MGRFIISRSAAGDRFILQSGNGQVLAVSKTYATLDACKKGIASLVVHAPIMPVRDLSAGEGGPNPKCEIVAAGKGFSYRVKAANGKVVITSVPYATKKACLRAVAMLRSGVADYEILFERQAGLVPLAMKMPAGVAAPRTPAKTDIPDGPQSTTTSVGTGVPDGPQSTTSSVGTGVPDGPRSATTSVGTGVPDGPQSTTSFVGTGVPDGPRSTTVSVVTDIPDGPQSATSFVGTDIPDGPQPTPNISAGLTYAPPILTEVTSDEPEFDDLPADGVIDLEERVGEPCADTALDGAQNGDIFMENPSQSPTPPTKKSTAPTPRLVRLQNAEPRAPRATAGKPQEVPQKRKGLFDILFKNK